MSSFGIKSLQAMEILDSRGRPTIMVTATRGDGLTATAEVPAGASTGSNEAHELRDAEQDRYFGEGVQAAVDAVNGELADLVCGRPWADQQQMDVAMTDADGTTTRERIGANAIVGVSLAVARLTAKAHGVPLWHSLGSTWISPRLPVPHFNVLNGGAHTRTALEFQEFMIAPVGARTMRDAVRAGAEIYRTLRNIIADEGYETGLGDEGGFAPDITTPEQAILLVQRAIEDTGYIAGREGVMIALDPAASQFCAKDGIYHVGDYAHSSSELIARYLEIIRDFPVWSLEDAMAENDLDGWRQLTEELGERVQIVGDDLLVTNPEFIARAAEAKLCTAVLIKPNQVGTVSETLDAIRTAHESGLQQMVSHRSGETTDDFIADLAVASGCGQIKSGAPARGERVAKYNRLMAIEASETGLPYGLVTGAMPVHTASG